MPKLGIDERSSGNVYFIYNDHGVGPRQSNWVDDVKLVQFLLNQARDSKSTYDELAIDGRCGSRTCAAILAFQNAGNAGYTSGFKANHDDGVVTATRRSSFGAHLRFTTIYLLNLHFRAMLDTDPGRLRQPFPSGLVLGLIRKAIFLRP
jgi:hypothetical protein